VAHRVSGALLACDGGEANRHRGPLANRIEESGFGPLADVGGDFEIAESATALGVHHALGYAFTIERLHLLDDVVILQQDRTVGAYRERVVVARRGNAGVGSRIRNLLLV